MLRRNSDLEIRLPDVSQSAATPVPEEADVDMTIDDPASSFGLPPHLRARFYPKSSSLKRASVSSSRRNSMSSLHSHQSTHGGPHSDHLAQHLRRASIIESRKARLADRAAHAEKVRLRAAVAKNDPRHLLREERALAAQQAREKLLAEITAKCEEEVRRAKQKAEDMKQRKAANHTRLRMELAEKFAEAEKRRILYQQSNRRSRTASSGALEKRSAIPAVPRLSEATAARLIQRAWRQHHSRMVIHAFQQLDFSLERLRGLSFEEVGALLSDEKVLTLAAKVLRVCGLHDTEGGTMGERGAVRVFLSSYMILTHPAQALASNGEQEEDLIGKGQDLLVIFEQVICQLSTIGVSPASISADLQTLAETYNTFVSAFHAWKAQDSTILIEIMLAQFVELSLIWETVKGDRAGGAADDYQRGIQQTQIRLLMGLKRLAGRDKAIKMVKQATAKAKRDRKRNGASTQAIPRAASVPSSPTEALPDAVQSPFSETVSSAEQQALEQLNEKEITPQDRFKKALTALPDNRTLVHELLINKEYKIDQAPYTEVRRQIMKHMCEMMRNDVAKGLGTSWTVAMASVIQDRLLRSLKPGNSLHVLISEVLDPTHIDTQCKAGTFSYEKFFDFMNNILPKLCAPFRDPVVKAFAEDTSGDAIDRLAKLMGIIDLMSLDHTNFMLQMAAPQLIQEGPGYEERAFARDVHDGTVTLQRTKAFWRSNRRSILEELRRRDPDNVGVSPPPASKIYAQGLVDLVLCNERFRTDFVPETLSLDHGRLQNLRFDAFKIAATASILLSAKNLLKRDVRSQWMAEAERIMSLDFSDIKPDRVQSILESTHPMPAATKSQLSATIRRVLSPATAACLATSASAASTPSVTVLNGPLPFTSSSSPPSTPPETPACFTDPVARLMLSRLRAHVLARLSASSASERIRATTTASNSLAAAGMPEFSNAVGKIVDSLHKVREVDWMCHASVYEGVWNEPTD